MIVTAGSQNFLKKPIYSTLVYIWQTWQLAESVRAWLFVKRRWAAKAFTRSLEPVGTRSLSLIPA
jgi:hypothetical protein